MDSAAPTAEPAVGLLRPAEGLSLLGECEHGEHGEPRFLVRLSDGQAIMMARLLYLITVAIAEAGPDGCDAEPVAMRVAGQLGREVAPGIVRYLVTTKLAPMGIVITDEPFPAPGRPPSSGQLQEPGHQHTPGTGHQPAPEDPPQPVGAGAQLSRSGFQGGPTARRTWWRFAAALFALSAAVGAVAAVTTALKPDAPTPRPALTQAVLANQAQAAAWISQQVSPDVIVSCDPQMCGQVHQHGFPDSGLITVSSSAGQLLPSGVVVATPAIRQQFGARLAADYAPLVIASFGSGPARVEVRAVAPHGAASYRSQAAAQHAALVSAGNQLLGNKNIQAAPAARDALRAGLVDTRLMIALSVLAADMPVHLVAFDDGGPGAGSAVPMRGAEIGSASPSRLAAAVAFLRAQQAPYRPAAAAVVRSGGQSRVSVRFEAVGLPAAGSP